MINATFSRTSSSSRYIYSPDSLVNLNINQGSSVFFFQLNGNQPNHSLKELGREKYCRKPSAEGLRKYDGVRTVQWKWLVAGGEPPTWQAILRPKQYSL